MVLRDLERSRAIPIRIYSPSGDGRKPIILFSHGFANSHEGYRYLGRHWASHGYQSVHVGHPGSNWATLLHFAPLRRLGAFFDRHQFENRIADLTIVLEALRSGSLHELGGDPARLGIAGHSVGALAAIEAAPLFDSPPAAVIALSPPLVGIVHRRSNDISVGIPTLYVRGSKEGLSYVDSATETPSEAASVYELVVAGADHDTFSDDERPPHPRREEQIELIQEMTTNFWRSFLGGEREARERFVRCLTDSGHCLPAAPGLPDS